MTSEHIARNFSMEQLKGIIEANNEIIKICQHRIFEAQKELYALQDNTPNLFWETCIYSGKLKDD